MSLTLKLSSLVIRTLSKPIATQIKQNARDHERFRRFCVSLAQNLHRIDMRLRLGLLQDPAVIERQIAKEMAEAEAKRKRALASAKTPTVKTEAESKRDEQIQATERKKIEEEVKKPPRIRPLSEAKAIETGANFISEFFLFCVAGGVIVFEFFRSKRKDSNRREGVEDRLDDLEKHNNQMMEKLQKIEQLLDRGESSTLAEAAAKALSAPRQAVEKLATIAEEPADKPASPKEEPTPSAPIRAKTPAAEKIPTLQRRDSEGRVTVPVS